MKYLYFFTVLLGLSVNWWESNHSYANNSILEEKSLISQTPAKVESFIASGTEPFWSITVNRNGIIYSSPEQSKRTYPYVSPIAAQGRPIDVVRVYRLNGRPNGTLIIKKANFCSDGMSDKDYPYAATLILGNQVLEGCASRE